MIRCSDVCVPSVLMLGLVACLTGCQSGSDDDSSGGGSGTMPRDAVTESNDTEEVRDSRASTCSDEPDFVCCANSSSSDISPNCVDGDWTCPETSTRRRAETCRRARDTAVMDGEDGSADMSDGSICGPKPEWNCCRKRDGEVLARFEPECGAPRDDTAWSCFFAEPQDAGTDSGGSGGPGGSGAMGGSGGQSGGAFTAGDTGNVWTGRCDDGDAG